MFFKLTKPRLLALSLISASAVTLPLWGGTPSNAQVSSPQSPDNPTSESTDQPAPGTNSGGQSTDQPAPGTRSGGQSTDQPAPGTSSGESSGNGLSQYSPNEAPMLKLGSTGEAVKNVQTFLKNGRLYAGAVDSSFGPETESAVKQFQVSQGLTSDGVVGPQTWGAMSSSSNPGESGQSGEVQSPSGGTGGSSGSQLP